MCDLKKDCPNLGKFIEGMERERLEQLAILGIIVQGVVGTLPGINNLVYKWLPEECKKLMKETNKPVSQAVAKDNELYQQRN